MDITKSQKCLRFKIGAENHPQILIISGAESTLLESYENAYEAVVEIVRASNAYKHTNTALYNYGNNFIVFTAPRGCGKTSTMLSFTEELHNFSRCEVKNSDDEQFRKINSVCRKLENEEFIILPPIDPTALDERHDILSVVLSRIFNYADQRWKADRANENGLENKNNIIRLLKECYSGVEALRQPRGGSREWTLEELSMIGDSSTLKENLYKLVQKVLSFNGEGYKHKHKHLVIQIDDAILISLMYLKSWSI